MQAASNVLWTHRSCPVGLMVSCCPAQELQLLTEQHEQRMQQSYQQDANAMQPGALQAALLSQDLVNPSQTILPGAMASTVSNTGAPLLTSGDSMGLALTVLCCRNPSQVRRSSISRSSAHGSSLWNWQTTLTLACCTQNPMLDQARDLRGDNS